MTEPKSKLYKQETEQIKTDFNFRSCAFTMPGSKFQSPAVYDVNTGKVVAVFFTAKGHQHAELFTKTYEMFGILNDMAALKKLSQTETNQPTGIGQAELQRPVAKAEKQSTSSDTVVPKSVKEQDIKATGESKASS
jgi:hypothetical protein